MAPPDNHPPAETAGESWMVPRPPAILNELPVAFRWEVTRRHPYYLRFWQLAQRHHESPSTDPVQRGLEQSAALILQTIGVTGSPPAPGAGPDELDMGSLSQAWESGAVAPLTFRGLVGMLLADLPPELLVQVGGLLAECGAGAEHDTARKHQFLTRLYDLKHAALDAFPRRPVVGVNIDAPQRVITKAVEQLVRECKEKQGIQETRRRDDKLDEYLSVWDLREGWGTDHYDGAQEQTLREVARRLQLPLSTVANRYRSAFRLITGHDYSPELWARVLGCLKVLEWLDPEELPRRTLRRPWRSRQRQPVAESVVQPPDHGREMPRLLNTAGVSDGELGFVDLVLDIQDLIRQGRSNAEIIAAVELFSPAANEVIDYFRERAQDLL
jgi:hypothetical protein